jgi:AcrR family transcriptional regulator
MTSPATDPRAARSREAILAAAFDLLAREGPGAITHQRVAQQAGVGRATVYRHWAAPENLLRDVLYTAELPFFARGGRVDLGLGWFRPANHREDDPPFVEHLGGGAGFFNVIRAFPTHGVGIAVMGNATKYNIDRVAQLALTRVSRDSAIRARAADAAGRSWRSACRP